MMKLEKIIKLAILFLGISGCSSKPMDMDIDMDMGLDSKMLTGLFKEEDTKRIITLDEWPSYPGFQKLKYALGNFKLDTGRYPTIFEGSEILITGNDLKKPDGYKSEGYLNESYKDLKDPWGRAYLYDLSPCPHFYTLGEDGQPGGEGANEDIRTECHDL